MRLDETQSNKELEILSIIGTIISDNGEPDNFLETHFLELPLSGSVWQGRHQDAGGAGADMELGWQW